MNDIAPFVSIVWSWSLDILWEEKRSSFWTRLSFFFVH